MRRKRIAVAVVGFAMAVCSCAVAQRVEGVARTAAGAVVPGAQVTIEAGSYRQTAVTDAGGRFSLSDIPVHSATITVTGCNTKIFQQEWDGRPQLDLVLQPADCCCTCICETQRLVVSATRIDVALEDAPADAVALSSEALASTPALALDDILRRVPGFTLFRRSSSRVANPTTQGVSLRGLGASGSSRALVLLDEVPLNDPFGGWVYWDRTARAALSSVELVRGGGAASLYGSTAMGGVVQFRTREPQAPSILAEGSWGNENTPELSLWTGTRKGPWEAAVSADLFRTDGYILVPKSQRGQVDTPANSSHRLVTADLGRHFAQSDRIFARGSYFGEDRHNGTPIQTNATQLADFATGWNHDSERIGNLSARMFGLFESYDQKFSAVAQDRSSETLTNHQQVPSQSVGGNAQWSRPAGRKQTLVAGFEMKEVHGTSNEQVAVGTNLNGGQQRTARIFGEDIIQFGPRLVANLSLGYDRWTDFDARSIQVRSAGTTVIPFAERSSDAVNPRASLLYRLRRGTTLTASGYRAFRSPTLNELYRSFRQGNVLTQSNPELRPERLSGVEGGIRQTLLSDHLNLHATFFWNDVTNAVVNITLSQTPTLITRQRQNVGRTLSTGLNLDAEWRLSNSLQLAGGYQYTHAVVSSYHPDPAVQVLNASLVGKWIPQVPHQQFTLQARYSNPKYVTATLQGTFVGNQFDDDQNAFLLDRYFTVDVYLGRVLGKGFEAFAAGENLFNTRYAVGATPVTQLGPPILARIGLRYQFPKR